MGKINVDEYLASMKADPTAGKINVDTVLAKTPPEAQKSKSIIPSLSDFVMQKFNDLTGNALAPEQADSPTADAQIPLVLPGGQMTNFSVGREGRNAIKSVGRAAVGFVPGLVDQAVMAMTPLISAPKMLEQGKAMIGSIVDVIKANDPSDPDYKAARERINQDPVAPAMAAAMIAGIGKAGIEGFSGIKSIEPTAPEAVKSPEMPQETPPVAEAAPNAEVPPVAPTEAPTAPEVKPTEVAPGAETSPAKLAIRTEADAIEANLTKDFGKLPEYAKMNMAEQAQLAQGILESDPVKAKNIAMGAEQPPSGLRSASVYEAVKIRALKDGDSETLRQLATESAVPTRLSELGQEIKAADSELMTDPVKVMQDVAKTRQEYSKTTGQKNSATVIANLQKKLADAEEKLTTRATEKVGRVKTPYGSKNKIVTTEVYQQAKAAIEASAGTAYSGLAPELVGNMTKVGTYHLEAGTRAFAEWSTKMVEDLGDKVKPHLDEIWAKVQEDKKLQTYLKTQKTRMANETAKYGEKLANLDMTPAQKKTFTADAELKQLRKARDAAKQNYEAARMSYGSVTSEEAANIVKLSDQMMQKMGEMEKGGDRFEYGAARQSYQNYIDNLKGEQAPLKTLIKGGIDKFKETAKTNKSKAVFELVSDSYKTIANNSVSMVATFDNSFLLRQGMKTLLTHPSAWKPGATKTFVDMWNTMGGKNAHDALMADVYSRPNYVNDNYIKAGIIAKTEEQFPSSLPERIPGVGRPFKASEAAFTGAGMRMRMDLMDFYIEKATKNGVTIDDAWLKDMGKVTNSLTSRGKWGKRGEPPEVRILFWAPRMIKGNWDVLTMHTGGVGLDTPFAKKEAAMNMVKVIGETAAVVAIANALKPGSAEYDPRSSDFGKIKAGTTKYDITGGAASIVTLASRVLTNATKSTKTGQVQPIVGGYGKTTKWDIVTDFLAGKTNPPAHLVVDWLKGTDYNHKPFSIGKEVYRSFTPIPVQNAITLKDGVSADKVAAVIADGLGLNTQTYAPMNAPIVKPLDRPKF